MTIAKHAGIKKDLDLSVLGFQEEPIAPKLARLLFLGFARDAVFKEKRYSFLLANPTEYLYEQFNFNRELLVVFSPQEEFHTRSLDFVDKTIAEYGNRLDKFCVILISRDENIEKKIKEIQIQDKESRIIVPFSYGDFRGLGNDVDALIIKRMKAFIYNRDLFAYDSPLKKDNYFFGRQRLIHHLYGKYQAGENSCIFGLRRIGKTSVLWALKRFIESRSEAAILVDCSDPAFHQRSWNEALKLVCERLVSEYNVTEINLNNLYFDRKNASVSFEKVLKAVQSHLKGTRLLIIFDELENITFDLSASEHWKSGQDYLLFWQTLRAIYQRHDGLFSFVLAGVNPKALEAPVVSGNDNPIYRFITPEYLDLFDNQETKEMVEIIGKYMGLTFDSEIYTYLVDNYGGHPFLTRQACSRLNKLIIDERPYKITKFRYRTEEGKLSKHLADYVDLIVTTLRERYATEYDLLKRLSLGDKETFKEFARDSYSLVEHLIGYGLVREDNSEYFVRIKAVEDYFSDKYKKEKRLGSLTDRWSEITKARNQLEVNFRDLMRRTMKLNLGPEKAKESILLTIQHDGRKKKLAAKSYDDMWGELYFSDLSNVVKKHWGQVGKIFENDMPGFTLRMDAINELRADAHAKPVDEQDVQKLLLAIEWVAKHVDNYS